MHTYYPSPTHNYRYELHKEMDFSAAHFIPQESAGKCQNIHGHTYFVNLTVVGNELNECGFLIDFKTLKEIVHGRYDHTLLNDHPEYRDRAPSSEVVADTIFRLVNEHLQQSANQPRCIQVILRETPSSYIIYRG